MRNFAILTVGFALAMLGPGGPSVAWANDPVVYDDSLSCVGDPAHDSIDIEILSVDSDDTGVGEIVVTMELCDPPTDTAKYMVFLENDDRILADGTANPNPTGVGTDGGTFSGELDCADEDDRTYDATGKVRIRKRKGTQEVIVSGPAIGVILPIGHAGPHIGDEGLLDHTPRIVFTLPYGTHGGESFRDDDDIYVWGRTQKKKLKADKSSDFAPDGNYSDGCVQPENPGETIEYTLH